MGGVMSRVIQACLIFSTVLMFGGCGANHASIYRSYSVGDTEEKSTSVLIDAKQRALLATPATKAGFSETEKHRRRDFFVCAEPSPDALSAISSTFAASAGGLFPSGAQVQAALASALEETAAELGRRNATIQLLRDGLYRQCEAYMNGLINEAYYEQIANKYANAMVTLLAIEELAGNGASLASASSGGAITATAQTSTSGPIRPEQESNGEEVSPAPEESTETEDNPDSQEPPPTEEERAEGSARGSSTANSPTVSVQVPQGAGVGAEHVSTAVNTMVTWFLTKDTVDYCLRALFTGVTTADDSFKTAFTTVCSDIIRQQMAQQGQIATAYEAATVGAASFSFDNCSAAIRTFWKPDGTTINTDNQQRIMAEMANAEFTESISSLLRKMPEVRRQVGANLGLLGCV